MLNFSGMTVKNDWAKIQSMVCEYYGVPKHARVYVRQDGQRANIALVWAVKNENRCNPYGNSESKMIFDPELWELLDAIPYE